MALQLSKKAFIISASSLLVAGLIAGAVYGTLQYNRANEASRTYLAETVEHLKAIGSAPDDKPKERIDIFRNKVLLENVAFGSFLSKQYRNAEAAQQQYSATIDKATPFFEQNYTLAALTPELLDFIEVVKQASPAGADAATQAAAVEDRAKKLNVIATNIDGLYFNEKNMPLKKTAVDEMRKMSTASKDTAEILRGGNSSQSLISSLQTEYSQSYEKVSDAIRQMPAYGQEILEYLKSNKDTLDRDFQNYIDTYDV